VIVLDASLLIAFLDPSDAMHGEAVSSMLDLGAHRLLVSPITHAEVLVGPARSGTLAHTQAALSALGVTEVALPGDAAPQLAGLRATTALRLPDCCVLLAAQRSASTVLSFDRRLAAAAAALGLGLGAS
jgi:predicted nucleic acid-binding protein